MAGRDRTCGASRFRRALYRLSYGHEQWARLGSNQRHPACRTGALTAELLARSSGTRDRTPVATGLSSRDRCPAKRGAAAWAEPRSPYSERGALPARRSPLVVLVRMSRLPTGERCCLCHSPTLRPWIDRSVRLRSRDRSSYVEALWSPCLPSPPGNSQAKAAAIQQRLLPAPRRGRGFLSQAGPRIVLELLQAEHHLCLSCRFALKRRGRPCGSPSVQLLYGQETSLQASERGPGRLRTTSSRRAFAIASPTRRTPAGEVTDGCWLSWTFCIGVQRAGL